MSPGRRLRRGLAVALLGALPLAAMAPAAGDDEIQDPMLLTVTVPGDDTPGGSAPDPGELTDAQLRWGVSTQAGSESHLPGQCAFLMAGKPGSDGDAGGSRVWTDADRGLYHSAAGPVRVLRPVISDGAVSEVPASFDTRCTAPDGQRVSYAAGRSSGTQVVLSGGTGRIEPDGTVRIRWKGTFTVVFYGGLVSWWATDPELRLDADGDGALLATLSGYGSDRSDSSRWERLPETRTRLVTFTGRELDTSSRGGTLVPDYCGVRAVGVDDQLRMDPPGSCWGSFPAGFLKFHQLAGDAAFWYSTGSRDEIKAPSNVTVSFDASRPVDVPRPDLTGGRTTEPDPFAPSTLTPNGGFAPLGGTGGLPHPGGGGGGAVVRPAASADDGDSITASSPFALPTLGGLRDALLPDGLLPEGQRGQRLAILTTILLVATSVAIVGFRRGWLTLPFRRGGS